MKESYEQVEKNLSEITRTEWAIFKWSDITCVGADERRFMRGFRRSPDEATQALGEWDKLVALAGAQEDIGGKKKGIIFWPETKMMTREEAVRWFKEIRAGSGVYRADFPDAMKGTLAKQHWDDPVFSLGVEYGVLIALKKIFGIVVDGGKKT